MAMKMDWMDVITGIAHVNSIPLALFQVKRGRNRFVDMAYATPLIVHRLKPSSAALFFANIILEGLVRRGCAYSRFGKAGIIPAEGRWGDPLRLAHELRT